MASIQLWVRAEFALAPAASLAIAVSVSPRWTTCIEPTLESELAGGAPRGAAGAASAGGSGCGAAGAATGGASALRAIAPSRVPTPAPGAVTGALATADWPGGYTGGSSIMAYSR